MSKGSLKGFEGGKVIKIDKYLSCLINMHNNTDCVHRGDEISTLKSELAGVVLVFVYVNFLVKQFYTRSRISEHSHPH